MYFLIVQFFILFLMLHNVPILTFGQICIFKHHIDIEHNSPIPTFCKQQKCVFNAVEPFPDFMINNYTIQVA